MFGTHFYHQKVRNCVALFGRLFNNLYVVRTNSEGEAISQVKVPLAYAPKRKYLDRIREQEDLVEDTKIALKLPRMSFEITNFAYDLSRQLTKVTTFNTVGNDVSNRQKFFPPVPYTISFQLNIYAKTQDDALQIVEQILPYFNPQYTVTAKPFVEEYPDFREDIPVIIVGLGFSDDYEGSMETRRTIVYTLDFEMKVNFHGPVNNSSIIRTAKTQVYDIAAGLLDSDLKVQTITVTPDPDSVIGLADSDFGFNTDITFDSA